MAFSSNFCYSKLNYFRIPFNNVSLGHSHSIVKNSLQFASVCRSLLQFAPFTSSLKNCRESMGSNSGHGFRGGFVGHGGSRRSPADG